MLSRRSATDLWRKAMQKYRCELRRTNGTAAVRNEVAKVLVRFSVAKATDRAATVDLLLREIEGD